VEVLKLKASILSPLFIRAATITLAIAVWESAVRLRYLDPLLFAAPTEILRALPYTLSELFIPNLLTTLIEYAVGLTLAVSIGLTVGILLGVNRGVYEALDPFIGFGMTTPKVVFVPLFILGLGIGWSSIATFGALLGVFPVIINSAAGIRQIRHDYVSAARAMGHSRLQTYFKVVFPFALPTFLTGLFLGSNLVMIGVIVMELIMGRVGLGPMMAGLAYNLRTPELYAATILTVLTTTSINGSIWALSHRMSRWMTG